MKHTRPILSSIAGTPVLPPASPTRWFRLALAMCLAGLATLAGSGSAAVSQVHLAWTNAPGGIQVSWTSPSLTPVAPFVHYEFQVQYSQDLGTWANASLIPGGFLGSASVNRTFLLLNTNSQGFVRLSYRLNMPGANLSGLDLSGADLRGANLAGANLSGTKLDGALLGGANLNGANLEGATFAGANLEDVDLTGFDLSSIDLGTILGMPVLTQVTANPVGKAADLVPHLPYNADIRDYFAGDVSVPGFVSTRHAMVMLETNFTVGQLNALLARYNAGIVASSPADALLPNAVLMVRLPATNAQELFDKTVALRAEPGVVASAPDVLLSQTEITISTGTAPGWNWDIAGTPAGGNWGLEYARVPQMWNLVGALETRQVSTVPTFVLDVDFPAHEDVPFAAVLGAVGPGTDDHGIHVAGIIGATRNNGKGIDGVNPFARMTAYTFQTIPGEHTNLNLGLVLNGFDPGRVAAGYRMVQDLRDILGADPFVRIINVSLGFNWYLRIDANRPTFTSPFNAVDWGAISSIASQYGRLMANVASSAPDVLIVCAAGNDYNLIPTGAGSPMTDAAINRGAPNIVVVESLDISGNHRLSSNLGGDLAAPGGNILSAAGTNGTGYASKSGTSMAAPFVSGIAGFLLAIDPDLDPATVKTLLKKNGQKVDAFKSMMEIDNLPGHDREVLKMLLDIDDGSVDGSRRVLVPNAILGQDRSFKEVSGVDFNDDNHVVGDEKIDMSDFRRWRDWLLHGEGSHSLNGSASHLKHDGNGDVSVSVLRDKYYFPRGDFNGDGKIDRTTPRSVPGWHFGAALSDLSVLTDSELWEDPDYLDPNALFNLIDSVDFHVSATNFFVLNPEFSEAVPVMAFNANTGQEATPDMGGGILSPDVTDQVLTVPTGIRYYVASDPIEIGEGTNVQMRSIGEAYIPLSQRGADYAVDLMLWEMTAVADTLNPALHEIISDPNTNRADAYIGTSPGSTNPPTMGARGWANREATLYAIASASAVPAPPTNNNELTTFAGAVRWQRAFIKDADLPDPEFLLKPMELALGGSAPGTNELNASAEIVVEMRAYDFWPDWVQLFRYRAEIAGRQSTGFRIVQQQGDLPPKELTPNGSFGVEYRQEKHRGTVDLEDVPDGHSFELRYRLNAQSLGTRGDGVALASLGDPLVYGSGLRMNYGRFGELPRVKRVTSGDPGAGFTAASAQATIEYLSKTNFYYRLYRGADADTTTLPFAMKLGIDGDDSMIDSAPLLPNPTEEDYTLENQPIDQPLDFDGDGMDDVYELRRPAILDPLNAADAFLDPDGDDRSNLEEYQQGTDPQTPDSPPTNPTLNFPGLLVPSYPGGELIDLNNDGLLDSASVGLNVALAHVGGTFDETISSPTPGLRSFAVDTAYLKLDADAFPDAVVVDQLTNRVFAFRGVGDGTFTPLPNYEAIGSPNQIASCNLNGDAFTDIAIFSQNGRGADLHVNNGDGTLTRMATVTTNAYGTGRGLALGDFNNDGRDDVVVGYALNAVVFFSTNGSAYGPGQPFPVGSSPESIAIADLNHDGRLDIITANRSSDDVSVLLANTSGGFHPQVRYPVGDMPYALRLADLNGDTHLDAALSLSSADYQVILPGIGNGAFAPLYTVPTGTFLIDLRDWNGDGNLDLVSSGGLVNFGNGDGTFDTRLQIVPTNALPTQVEAIDLNGDGRLELVGLQTQLNSIDVWEHAAVTGTNRLLSSFAVGPYVTAFTHGDFNGDGRVDLAVATRTNAFGVRGSNQVVVLTNAGNFAFADAGHYPVDARPNHVTTGDFNGDGAPDLAVEFGGGTVTGGSRIVSLRNNGSGVFQTGVPVVVGNTLSTMLAANAEADSRDELLLRGSRLVGNTTVSFLEVFAADGAGGWTNRQVLAYTNVLGAVQIIPANGDAYPDLVASETDRVTGARSLRMYPGSPTGFGAEQILATEIEFTAFSHLGDLNGDGLLDAAAGGSLYLASPGGGFHPAQDVYVGAGGIQAVADFNRDGKPDLLNGLSILLQR